MVSSKLYSNLLKSASFCKIKSASCVRSAMLYAVFFKAF